jgi:hypothetical protein
MKNSLCEVPVKYRSGVNSADTGYSSTRITSTTNKRLTLGLVLLLVFDAPQIVVFILS